MCVGCYSHCMTAIQLLNRWWRIGWHVIHKFFFFFFAFLLRLVRLRLLHSSLSPTLFTRCFQSFCQLLNTASIAQYTIHIEFVAEMRPLGYSLDLIWFWFFLHFCFFSPSLFLLLFFSFFLIKALSFKRSTLWNYFVWVSQNYLDNTLLQARAHRE